MKSLKLEILPVGKPTQRSWQWYLNDERGSFVASGRLYTTKRAAKKGFFRFWKRLRKLPIISDQKINK